MLLDLHLLIFGTVLNLFTSPNEFTLSNLLLTNYNFLHIWFSFTFLTLYNFSSLDPNFTLSQNLLPADYYMNSPTIYYQQAHSTQKHSAIKVILVASFTAIHLNYLTFILLLNFLDTNAAN